MKEIGTDWYRAKNAPGFLPTGPLLVPGPVLRRPAGRPGARSKLNGKAMQDESTADMLFGVATLIIEASQTMPLLPGRPGAHRKPRRQRPALEGCSRTATSWTGTITGLGTQVVRCMDEVVTEGSQQ